MYINELNELKRLVYELKKSPKNIFQVLKKTGEGKRVYAYTTFRDPMVSLMTGVKICSLFLKILRKRSEKVHPLILFLSWASHLQDMALLVP